RPAPPASPGPIPCGAREACVRRGPVLGWAGLCPGRSPRTAQRGLTRCALGPAAVLPSLLHERDPGTEDPVQMPRWPPRGWVGLPRRFEETPLAQADQDGVEGAGLEDQFLAEVVAVARTVRVASQNLKYGKGLRGWTASHGG